MLVIDIIGLLVATAIFGAGFCTGKKLAQQEAESKITDLETKLIEAKTDLQQVREDNAYVNKLLEDKNKR